MVTWSNAIVRLSWNNSVRALPVFWLPLIYWRVVLMCSRYRWSLTTICPRIARTIFIGKLNISIKIHLITYLNLFLICFCSISESVAVVVSVVRVLRSTSLLMMIDESWRILNNSITLLLRKCLLILPIWFKYFVEQKKLRKLIQNKTRKSEWALLQQGVARKVRKIY